MEQQAARPAHLTVARARRALAAAVETTLLMVTVEQADWAKCSGRPP
jgi:hypothetical protein